MRGSRSERPTATAGTPLSRRSVLAAGLAALAPPAETTRPAARRAAAGDSLAGYPQATVTNGALTLTVLLPDPARGYYRGSRFDWSGLIARAAYGGHTLFAPWKSPHDPEDPEGAFGTAEEFGMKGPTGYAEAKPGETFLKIGVGLLRKPDEAAYQFNHPYPFARRGRWKVWHGSDWLEFQQELDHPGGWSYRYTKRIRLAGGGKPAFTIHRTLENRGGRELSTDHYCHNFTRIDDDPIGPDYRLVFPFELSARLPPGQPAELRGKQLVLAKPLGPGESIYTELSGFSGHAGDHGVTLENTRTGAGLQIRGSLPLSDFHVWSVSTALCPEPFVRLHVPAGKRQTWSSEYLFRTAAR